MKILAVKQIREGDAYTIQHEPISSYQLMERAGTNCTQWIIEEFGSVSSFAIFAGPGNNGGDGLVIARQLIDYQKTVVIYIVEYTKNYSPEFAENLKKLQSMNADIHILNEANSSFGISASEIVIDAIFGSGLSRKIEGFTASIIQQVNQNKRPIISIDIASGLSADGAVDSKSVIIQPSHTLSIAFPKIAFFIPENEAYVGQWHMIDIGIHPDFIQKADAFGELIYAEDLKPLLLNRAGFSHKGNYGHALLFAGSYGKMGAAVLAAQSAMRSGLGLLTAHIPSSGVDILQSIIPESMLSIDKDQHAISEIPTLLNYNAIGIGPGIGQQKQTAKALKLLIQNCQSPLVLDADALNILGENKTWLAFLPKNSILTPHPKEFERLAGKANNKLEAWQKQKDLSIRHQIFIVLKGKNTSISTPDGKLYFNTTGNPGMATAGSGDVLTGIITSLLAQNYSPLKAALLGTFIHGLAGDMAALKYGFESLIASDIIEQIPNTFIYLHS